MIDVRGVRAVVTDIEGTTSSIAFVHEVLFPYARERLAGFIARHRGQCAPLLDAARAAAGPGAGELDDDAIVRILRRWIDEDRKAAPLKTLQGMIWRGGYESGDLVGHVYPDAARRLRQWHGAGLGLHVYSSGSVEAQKLLFAHSAQGDLTPLFDRYFDTGVGAKANAGSYRRIADTLGLAPGSILFLSDAEAEIAAAQAAGLQSVRLVREGPRQAGEAADFEEIGVSG